ncbi:MAG: hypothetical protein HY080_03535 [Gammaproteobacteria bacterium]|nr:hypothetical protein [Gammaproteobacteria bacterium]
MSNLTITTDDEVLKQARMCALAEGTSVNAVLRDYLVAYAGMKQDKDSALQRILSLLNAAQASRGNQTWTREELHERK